MERIVNTIAFIVEIIVDTTVGGVNRYHAFLFEHWTGLTICFGLLGVLVPRFNGVPISVCIACGALCAVFWLNAYWLPHIAILSAIVAVLATLVKLITLLV